MTRRSEDAPSFGSDPYEPARRVAADLTVAMTEASERAFHERVEQLSLEFRRRYGLADDQAWTDELLEQALADHGYPPLGELPDTAQGPFAANDPLAQFHDRRWQRVNASHLLGHLILRHEGGRCVGCRDWGKETS